MDLYEWLISNLEPPCSYRPEVICVTAPAYEADKVKAVDQAKERSLVIVEFRESEYVKPGHIFFVCPFCNKEV